MAVRYATPCTAGVRPGKTCRLLNMVQRLQFVKKLKKGSFP